jgi:phage host-nuclease inhibitor protein Gam
MSDQTLQQQIQAAIERDLPKQVGDALQQRLTQADRFECELADAAQLLARRDTAVKDRDATIHALTGDLTKLRADLAVFQQREAAFAAAERELLVATLKLERADAVTNAVKEVVRSSPRTRKFVVRTP